LLANRVRAIARRRRALVADAPVFCNFYRRRITAARLRRPAADS
jgi:hypothetical protein